MNCLEGLKLLDDNSVDSIVTDPPYLLNFMGKEWDKVSEIEPSFGYWLAGFTDGEGCFRIHKVRNGDYFECHFQIKLRQDDRLILEKIQKELGFGRIQDVEANGTSNPASVYIVNKKEDCLKIADLFLKFPLKAKKQNEFLKWYEALVAWKNQKKGNRWNGKPDVSSMKQAYEELKKIREYKDQPTPINKDSFFHYLWAKECLRVLKPGGHLLAFGGTRTYHRMTCAIEDAGFEIRDCIQWLYGSGFPKSMDISKAIDKSKGAEREIIGHEQKGRNLSRNGIKGDMLIDQWHQESIAPNITAPTTPEAKQWQGYGTALKPANEPIVLARKPLSEKTVATNVLKWGTGGINIDECRVKSKDMPKACEGNGFASIMKTNVEQGYRPNDYYSEQNGFGYTPSELGRFPANVILDEEAGKLLDEQSGISKSKASIRRNKSGIGNIQKDTTTTIGKGDVFGGFSDSGGASRFFYCAKSSKKERGKDNIHPTVKPIKLMEYLITLITPPEGIVLDPFTGSGTTPIAAVNKGFSYVGFEMNEEYCRIAEARIKDFLCPSLEPSSDKQGDNS